MASSFGCKLLHFLSSSQITNSFSLKSTSTIVECFLIFYQSKTFFKENDTFEVWRADVFRSGVSVWDRSVSKGKFYRNDYVQLFTNKKALELKFYFIDIFMFNFITFQLKVRTTFTIYILCHVHKKDQRKSSGTKLVF